MRLNPVFAILAGGIDHPVSFIEIPVDHFADASFESFRRFPAEFVVNFADIDGGDRSLGGW